VSWHYALNSHFRVIIQTSIFAISVGTRSTLHAGTADAFDGVWLSVRATATLAKGKVPDWSELLLN